MYFITTKRMLEVCFSAHPNIQYRTKSRRPFSDFLLGVPLYGRRVFSCKSSGQVDPMCRE